MNVEGIIETSRHGHVGIIRLINERGRNSLINPMREGLVASFTEMADDPDIRAVLLIGRGKVFCAGGDFGMMQTEGDPWSAHQRFRRSSRWLTDLLRYPKPIIVGVNGAAVGGGIGLALIGDFIYAAEEQARFIAGFLRLGLIPDIGMMYTLPRLVGMSRAKSFVFGGETWTAQQAADAGLIAGAVPDAELEARCMAKAEEMAAVATEGFSLAKWLMGRSLESSLDDMMTMENLGQSLAYSTEAMREGLTAITERRPPDFAAASERETATKAARRRRQ
ncbi:MAG: enoyl-CoA hydratase/isomerase family protein [Rhodopila sp.]|nr:enoyl-CoA hydratase/isomerase family protein [Rhodopila sp.]